MCVCVCTRPSRTSSLLLSILSNFISTVQHKCSQNVVSFFSFLSLSLYILLLSSKNILPLSLPTYLSSLSFCLYSGSLSFNPLLPPSLCLYAFTYPSLLPPPLSISVSFTIPFISFLSSIPPGLLPSFPSSFSLPLSPKVNDSF